MFSNYAVVQGADKFMPIDVHIPGCPPRPEAVLYGFNRLERKIQGNPDQGWRASLQRRGDRGVGAGRPAQRTEGRGVDEAYEFARELIRA